ncbi:hypothetical protein CU044_2517 [Streptomyces sp. L-9-10]|nr:hypothetical protein CU044_2517 [Streptomyces sp. L-9-10]
MECDGCAARIRMHDELAFMPVAGQAAGTAKTHHEPPV